MFHQFEGLMVGPDISLAHMKTVMTEAMKALVSPDIDFRFRTGYFPFVEPGLEVDMRWKTPHGAATGRWLEVVGCGMMHPIVLQNGNVDPKKYRGFAFGFGVERLLMIKHQISDLRLFYEGDVRFLSQF
jgi:phenylalanyl-tRNA synthetase alpha chain